MRRILSLIAVMAVAGFALAGPAAAADASKTFTPDQEQAIRDVVRDYLVKHPEVLMEALQALQEKQQAAEKDLRQKALAEHRQALIADPASPVAGNPKGNVTVVEFFDYRCPYCKSVSDRLFDTIKADGNVRFVLKEFPILGPASVFASKAALAARKQGKYIEFHQALMAVRGNLDDGVVMSVAKSVGLDTKKLRDEMDGRDIAESLENNMKLAQALKIDGTPAFVVGDQLVPGAISTDALKQLIDQTRKTN
ncbi:MAG: DsbA family protein [Candidatus Eiseniibacteriota bacterium]